MHRHRMYKYRRNVLPLKSESSAHKPVLMGLSDTYRRRTRRTRFATSIPYCFTQKRTPAQCDKMATVIGRTKFKTLPIVDVVSE